MKAAIKLPGKDWEHVDVINANLDYLNKVCEGYIELVPNLFTNAVMYCNEEGKINNLPENFDIFRNNYNNDYVDTIVGNVIMFGPYDEDGTETDLTTELFEKTIQCIENL